VTIKGSFYSVPRGKSSLCRSLEANRLEQLVDFAFALDERTKKE